MIKIGFFDIFNQNRKELENLNDDFFKSLKKDDKSQPELFEASSIEISTDSISDYPNETKMNFEEEYTGIIFSCLNECDCELCRYIKFKDGQEVKINRSIYLEYNFILYISLEKKDNIILENLCADLDEEGNCEIEIYFSDSKEVLTMKNKLTLNDPALYNLIKLLKEIPFYIELKEKRDA